MTVRCKFKCESKTEYISWNKTLYSYKFSAVTNGSEENQKFWEYTPGGNLAVECVKDGTFQVGKEYYLDLAVAGE